MNIVVNNFNIIEILLVTYLISFVLVFLTKKNCSSCWSS